MSNDQPQVAAVACHQVLAQEPDDGLAHALLGRALNASGDAEAALEHFTQATRLAPHLPEPWLALAQALTQSGQAPQALAA